MTPSNPSSSTPRRWSAKFSDGQSARSWPSHVRLDDRGIIIERSGEDDMVWPYGALGTPHPLSRGEDEALVSYTHMPGAQLFVPNREFVEQLSRLAPRLTTSSHRWRWAKPLIAVALLIIAGFALVWALDLRPAHTVAKMLPTNARQTVGQNVVSSFAGKHKTCTSPAGRAALDKLMARLLGHVEDPRYFNITVVDWRLVNAFAAPGGQMLLTSGLIGAAKTPEEVAGVLAHEIGHGIELHPEAGLVRAIGLSALVELLTGGSSGTLSNLSAMFLQNSYIRQDERAADQQALSLLREARISQAGLADFFERIGNRSSKRSKSGQTDKAAQADKTGQTEKTDETQDSPSGSFGPFDLLRTHPFPAERAEAVRSSARYDVTQALTRNEWRALKQICR